MLCDCDEVIKVACLELKKHPYVHIVLYYIYLVCTFRNENYFIFHSLNYIIIVILYALVLGIKLLEWKTEYSTGVVDNYVTPRDLVLK